MDEVALLERVGSVCDVEAAGASVLSGGCVGDVRLVRLADGTRVVCKAGAATLDIEGRMLRYLRERSVLPVPRVVHAECDLLVMTYIEHDGRGGASGQRHLAELLAALHGIEPDDPGRYGLGFDTLIGSLPQRNGWDSSWIRFFGEQRLAAMAAEARLHGGIDRDLESRIARLIDRLDDLLGEIAAPGLLHGDVWGGNVLYDGGRVAALIDPAVYYGDPEIELAFGTLFGTLGEAFFQRYGELRPLRAGFFESRRDLYNLYPLLVHARLFGGSYGASVERIISSLGF